MQTANNKHISILIVDDEADIREILQFNLENEGYSVDLAESAEQALSMIEKKTYSLMLLDVMMGGISGFKLADKLRKADNLTPIIFLTAKNTENDVLTGFSTGGDDYISKPFSIKEVIARTKGLLRRCSNQQASPESSTIEFNDLKMDFDSKKVYINNKNANLTKTEFKILHLLIKNAGKVLSRNEILDKAWENDGIVVERTVDVHIARLRKKIEKYGNHITNRVGYGYTFDY